MQYCTKGKHIPKGMLICRKAGGDNQVEYIKIELTDVMVSSYQFGGSGSAERIMESISLNFGQFKYVYTEQLANGGEGAKPEFAYNIAKNQDA